MAAPPTQRFQLRRFTKAQAARAHGHCQALKELRRGQKRSCWIWWIVPVPAKRQMSVRARRFAIASDVEAAAYLRFEHDGVALRANLVEIFGTILSQLQKRSSGAAKRAAAERNGDVPHGYSVACAMLGSVDAAKLLCSLTMWRRVAVLVQDEDLLSLVTALDRAIQHDDVPQLSALQYDFYAVSPPGALELLTLQRVTAAGVAASALTTRSAGRGYAELIARPRYLRYDTSVYDFVGLFTRDYARCQGDLSQLHIAYADAVSDFGLLDDDEAASNVLMKLHYDSALRGEFLQLYRRFVSDIICPLFDEDVVFWQTKPVSFIFW